MHLKLFRAAAVTAVIASLAATGPVGLASAATTATTATMAPMSSAAGLAAGGLTALSGSSPDQFLISPALGPDGASRGYFRMTIVPGGTDRDMIQFTNGGSQLEKIIVGTTNGLTATNSGSAFGDLTGKCAGIGCWVTGLPATVTLEPHITESVPFLVKVPAGTRPKQYLAGITARPATGPQSAPPKAGKHGRTHVTIVTQVTIGVAVTVGPLARLRTSVAVTGVTATWIDSLVRLTVNVRNYGQRFTRGAGDLACRLGGTARTYPIAMDTVLPGDGAGLPVNGTGMHAGTWRCTVKIKDSGGRTDSWTGSVTVPGAAPADTVRVANGDYTAPPGDGIPNWAIALFVLAGLVLVSLWAVLLRRGRNRSVSNPAS